MRICVPPGVVAGQSHHQLPDIVGRSRPPRFSFRRRSLRGVRFLRFADPSPECLIAHDRDKVLQLLAQLPAVPQEPALLLFCDDQPLWQTGAEYSVLLPEVRDLAGEFLAADGGQQGENGVQKADHLGTVAGRWTC